MAYGIDDYVIESYLDDSPDCDLCGEEADGDMGTFWDANRQSEVGGPIGENVWAHAQCGLDAGLPLA